MNTKKEKLSIQEEFRPDFDWIFDWTSQKVKIVKNPKAGEADVRRDNHLPVLLLPMGRLCSLAGVSVA